MKWFATQRLEFAAWTRNLSSPRSKVSVTDQYRHMRWLKSSVRANLYGLLGHPVDPTESTLDVGTEDIRTSMLELLGHGGFSRFPQLTRRIRYAGELQGLWYLRGDLMAAVASMYGEAIARERLREVSELFQGLLPGGLSSRPSPLVS
ncbi:hypothetical protein ACPWT1_16080 [Ramlibacter sp. MMS24-I3-19]|uniref:hypothetical protein n=1 Tax=Ramlibacter sp. MMS24-I3-19 TaxID=3416606 RepID=UPI003CFE7995